jgi:hypothetical protein
VADLAVLVSLVLLALLLACDRRRREGKILFYIALICRHRHISCLHGSEQKVSKSFALLWESLTVQKNSVVTPLPCYVLWILDSCLVSGGI